MTATDIPPDSPVRPVELAQIAEILDTEHLHYFDYTPETASLKTIFNGLEIQISLTQNPLYLVLRTTWEHPISSSEAPKLLAVTNEWNQTQIMPTLSFYEKDSELYTVFIRTIFAEEGLSNHQLAFNLLSSIEAMAPPLAWLNTQFPTENLSNTAKASTNE
ncbi:YbjN domain-containing protein [Corynebacterium caspium]|uniref:YbjN domain-containing protein n=1 Tax=Corynebacterium caspium TaxID=234828 RepID=UPI00035D33C6|nr:YbjN domain-containing protein [Corynebacterium caspium]WKD59210.1 hypothetical protein CCASP_04065 [Corynebacterium caspium DSM 44850]